MLTFVLAGLRYRRARLLLSSVAVALGVAFVSGTLLLNASMNASYYSRFATGAANVAALVAAPHSGNPPGQFGGQTVPRSLLGTIRDIDGVAAADGRVIGPAAILDPATGHVAGNGFGVNVTAADPSLSGFTLVSGHLPDAPDEVDIDKSTAADEHLTVGQQVKVVTSTGGIRVFTLAGTISTGVNPGIGNSTVLAFQTSEAFSVTGQSSYALIVARARPGVSQHSLATRLAAVARGYQVQTGAQFASEEANDTTGVGSVLTTGILIFAAIALIVACIVIYNTFGILIAQRSREFALLRCVGASRRQVFRAMLGEALCVGLASSAGGLLLGIALSWVLGHVLAPPGTGPAPLVIAPSAVAVAVITGVVVTVGASVLPAAAATRIAPVAAVSGAGALAAVTRRSSWLRVAFAAVTAVAGLALTLAGLHTKIPAGLFEVAAGGCVFFLAVLALGPLITPPLVALLAAPWRAVITRMAVANARRNPHRIAASTAALTIGVTLMTLFTVVFSSVQASTDAAIAGHYPFDYVVETSGSQLVPPRVVSALDRAPGLSTVASVYTQHTTVNGHQLLLGAYSHDALGVMLKPKMVAGSLAAVGPGTAAAGSGRVGSFIEVSTPDAGTVRLRVVAVYNVSAYRTPVPDVLISTADFVRGFRPAGPGAVVIDASPGVSTASSRAAVNAAVASDPLLKVDTLADYKATLNSGVDSILDLVTALVALAVLIALTGISNTLTLSVIERTRESALLRALGLTRGQLRQMLLTEAVLMAVVAVLLGGGLGIGFGAAIIGSMEHSGNGIGTLSVPFGHLALYAVIAAVAGMVAGVLPSRRAARTDLLTQLRD
ncbi:MAG TPA: FtsX-like permease family protein [Streptosporangiaceae bacterium]